MPSRIDTCNLQGGKGGNIVGKTGKTAVLRGFYKIERSVHSSGPPPGFGVFSGFGVCTGPVVPVAPLAVRPWSYLDLGLIKALLVALNELLLLLVLSD